MNIPRFIALFCLTCSLFIGYKAGKRPQNDFFIAQDNNAETKHPVKSKKPFVFIVYAYNQGLWVDRTLRSIFEQEYDDYRIIFIDDGSKDNTFVAARDFILENNQESRTLMVRNQKKLGYLPCLHELAQSLPDQEIVIPIQAKDWFAHSGALNHMNMAFQNPDVWTASTSGITYPSFEKIPLGFEGFYAALFKQLPSSDLHRSEKGIKDPFASLRKLAIGRSKHINDVLLISNATAL